MSRPGKRRLLEGEDTGYTYIYIYIHTYVYVYIYIYTHMCMYIYIYLSTWTSISAQNNGSTSQNREYRQYRGQ